MNDEQVAYLNERLYKLRDDLHYHVMNAYHVQTEIDEVEKEIEEHEDNDMVAV